MHRLIFATVGFGRAGCVGSGTRPRWRRSRLSTGCAPQRTCLSERDKELLERWGCESGTPIAFCQRLAYPQLLSCASARISALALRPIASSSVRYQPFARAPTTMSTSGFALSSASRSLRARTSCRDLRRPGACRRSPQER